MLDYIVNNIPRFYQPPVISTCLPGENIFNFSRSVYYNREDYIVFELKQKRCEVLDKKDVLKVLEANPAMIKNIFFTLSVINDYFGKDQKTSLDYFVDEEDGGGEGKIFLNIILKDCSADNLEKFNKINDWFIDNVYKFNQKFNINLDFENQNV
jgi:hypothetical protein